MRIERFLAALMVIGTLMTTSCSEVISDINSIDTMPVTDESIDGCWELKSGLEDKFDNGSFLYIYFYQEGQRYELWTNIKVEENESAGGIVDPTSPLCTKGDYTIEDGDRDEYIMQGTYDHNDGGWGEGFIVKLFKPGNAMQWTSIATGRTLIFARTKELPEYFE